MRKIFLASLLAITSLPLWAENTKQTVKQVTESVTLTEDVDYIISDKNTPFGENGSVNIENTEHAVVIVKMVKPSVVIKNLLKDHVFINGEQAVNGTNCQVKMYNTGAIIMPYGKNFKPLTCYTEQDFGGDECNSYTEGSQGGYMKTLSKATLNNEIRSFKLKRGYMVTFAVGTGGWGYSRCFIADKADLEFAKLPAELNGRISSYRLFKWLDSSKKGLASDANANTNALLNTTWCYDWADGNTSLLPDVEWIPNHIYEDWPSSSAIGSREGTCHTKNNNEPANSADDRPQTVEEVLNNWQNMMRTGLRLCSPATHDGGWGWHNNFMNEIDARGWRCDVVDFHGYWNSGTWNNLDGMINSYAHGRPVWISEWVWGSSWNNEGIFRECPDGRGSFSQANQQKCYDGTKPILDRLNSNSRVERYAYWNSEADCSKIYHYGEKKLSKLGEYYASMDAGLAYNSANEFVPKVVLKEPGAPTGTYKKTKSTFTLEWTDPNGDMLDKITIQRKAPGTSSWKSIGIVEPKDKTAYGDVDYTYTDTIVEPGLYSYRIQTTGCDKKNRTSAEVGVTVSAANSVGSLGYGSLDIANTEDITTEFETRTDAEGNEVSPVVFIGMLSNKNTANGISNQLVSVTKSSFKFRLSPWPLTAPVSIDKAEAADYLLLPTACYQLNSEQQLLVENIGSVKGDTVEVAFSTPFPEGTTPVVIAQNATSSKAAAPTVIRVWDVTATGFKVILTRQEGASGTYGTQNVNYMAALPGIYPIGQGKQLTVYRDAENPVGGTTYVSVPLTDGDGQNLHMVNPIIVGAPQTFNFSPTSCFRQQSVSTEDFTVGEQTYSGVYSIRVKRQADPTTSSDEKNNKTNGDLMGWFILSDDVTATGDEPNVFLPTAIRTVSEAFAVSTQGGMLHASDPRAKAFNLGGQQVGLDTRVPAGVYVITNGKQSLKVLVK